jgi:hypothetical protein
VLFPELYGLDAQAGQLAAAQSAVERTARLSSPNRIPDRLLKGYEVLFDDEGKHRVRGELILLIRPEVPGA